MPTRLSRRRRRALLPLFLAGALSLGATAASGIQPSAPRVASESAFQALDLGPSASTEPGGVEPDLAASAPVVGTIADPWLNVAQPAERARPPLPATTPTAVAKSTTPKTSHSISGRASWYCDAGISPCTSDHPDSGGFDAYAAAGPRLRAAIGSAWRGKIVYVDGIRVKLIDWCQCHAGESNEKLLDLYHDVFLRTGSPVTVRW